MNADLLDREFMNAKEMLLGGSIDQSVSKFYDLI